MFARNNVQRTVTFELKAQEYKRVSEVIISLTQNPYFRVDFFKVLADALLLTQGDAMRKAHQVLRNFSRVSNEYERLAETHPYCKQQICLFIDEFMKRILRSALSSHPEVFDAVIKDCIEPSVNIELHQRALLFIPYFIKQYSKTEAKALQNNLKNTATNSDSHFLRLALACTQHPYFKKNSDCQELSGIYAPYQRESMYEGYAAGLWLVASFFVDIVSIFFFDLHRSVFTDFSSPNALFIIGLKLIVGLSTAFLITRSVYSEYQKELHLSLLAHDIKETTLSTLQKKVDDYVHRFTFSLSQSMYAFQWAVFFMQIVFMFIPPAQYLWVAYVFSTAIIAGIFAAMSVRDTYIAQARKDFMKEWDTFTAQRFSKDLNCLVPCYADEASYRYHAEKAFNYHITSRTFLWKLRSRMLATFVSNVAWQLASFVPCGLGQIITSDVKPAIIYLLITIVSSFVYIGLMFFTRMIHNYFRRMADNATTLSTNKLAKHSNVFIRVFRTPSEHLVDNVPKDAAFVDDHRSDCSINSLP